MLSYNESKTSTVLEKIKGFFLQFSIIILLKFIKENRTRMLYSTENNLSHDIIHVIIDGNSLLV